MPPVRNAAVPPVRSAAVPPVRSAAVRIRVSSAAAVVLVRSVVTLVRSVAAATRAPSNVRRGTLLRASELVRAVCERLRAVAEHDADLGAFQDLVDVAFAELRVQDELAFAEGLVHRVARESVHRLTERL